MLVFREKMGKIGKEWRKRVDSECREDRKDTIGRMVGIIKLRLFAPCH